MKSKLYFFIFILIFLILSSTVFASKTYVIEHKVNDGNEIIVLRQKANNLNPIYYEIDEENEEKERLLEKKFRRVKAWVDNKFYIGYHEEVFGSKNLYLNWKDVPNEEEKESFYPTYGYKYFKGKTFFERIEKYSLK